MNIDEIITEEINHEIGKLDFKTRESVKKVLNELFSFSSVQLLKNMGSQESILDEKESLSEENWEWLIDRINESYNDNSEEWNKELKKQKLVILCYKFFSKQDLLSVNKIEEDLKFDIKKYFTALQNYSDSDNFREKFFNLPSEILKNFCRFILNKSKKLNSEIKITKEELKERIKTLAKERRDMIEKISLISKKYQNILDITMLKELYNCGLFFEDNFLNRGVNEYVSKMVNNPVSAAHISNTFNSTFLNDLKTQSETSLAYSKHIEALKTEQTQEYFTSGGFQVGLRFENEIEAAKNSESDENLIIDKTSRFKEPNNRINKVIQPWETDGSDAIDSGDVANSDNNKGNDFGGGVSGGSNPFAGGSEFEGGEESGIGDISGEDLDDGNETGNDDFSDEESDLPKDSDGFPIDFGTSADNTANTNSTETSENSPEDEENKKQQEPA